MKISKKIGLVVAVFCIIALMVAAVSAAGNAGAPGQQPPGPGKQPGTGQGQQQQGTNNNVNNPVQTQVGTGNGGTNQGKGQGQGPVQGTAGNQAYTMEQTLSDQGQQATIAFDALAFLTGEACSDTFLPPGKVADYAGFQYLRDNDATQMGHNTDFVTRISDNVLSVLNDDQLAQFIALSKTEAPLSSQYGYMRFPLTKAFRAQLEGTIPTGSSGLDKAAVMAYSAKLYDVDASISLDRAKAYTSVIRSLNQTQRAYLDKMASGGMLSMPEVDASAVLKNSGQDNSVAMRTYASEMFAWYAGDVTSDVYFCPERQATYFGSFYMKDRPAMGNPDYSISTTMTGDSGEDFLNGLTDSQRGKITSLVDLQRADLNEIVAKRTAIATELRTALTGDTIDESLVRSLSARYGELDGEISYYYATHFADVGQTTTSEQKKKMIALRNLANFTCDGAYLYSQPISMPQNVPSDFLFGVGQYDSAQMATWLQGLQQTTVTQGPGTGTNQGPGNGPGAGNVTRNGQGPLKPGQGQATGTNQGQGSSPRAGNVTQNGQGNAQGQQNRIPVEEVMAQLGQKGYDISSVQTLLKSGDREALKTWLDTFKKSNPGVVEAIEGTGTNNQQPQKTGQAGQTSGTQARGQAQAADNNIFNMVKNWFSHL
ncbi:MAG: hypothetical protein WCJ93_08590 [Methanomicrobiales archaeon]